MIFLLRRYSLGVCLGGALLAGCNTAPQASVAHATRLVSPAAAAAPTDLLAPRLIDLVDAYVDPPTGWQEDPRRADAKHVHLVWVSPTGDTAYGVILIYLPLPVGPDLVLWGFLNQMRKTDQEATLLSKESAPDLQGLRFVADSHFYRIHVNLSVHGWRAWAVYAGSLRSRPENARELDIARRARDHTKLNLPDQTATIAD